MRRGRVQVHGLTLIELMVGLAIMAVLATLAVPEFGRQASRWKLQAGAERLASDLTDARFDAARLDRTQHVHVSPGAQSCWSLSELAACDCAQEQQCQRSRHRLGARGTVRVDNAAQIRFEATAVAHGGASSIGLSTRQGDRLTVVLGPMGRARICAPDGPLLGYAPC